MPSAVAGGGIALTRYTEKIIAGLKEKIQRDLPFAEGGIMPVRNGLNFGVRSVVEQFIEGAGEAKFMSEVANDIPLVSASTGEDSYPVETIVSGFFLNYIDLEGADATLRRVGGGTIQNRMAALVYRAIQEKANDFVAFGAPARGVTGFMNHPSVTADNNSFDAYAGGTTFSAFMDFLNDAIVTPFRDQIRLNRRNFMMVVPDSFLGKMINTYGDDGTTSVYMAFLRDNKDRGLQRIVSINEAKKGTMSGNLPASIGVAGKDRIATFIQDPDILAFDASGLGGFKEVQKATGYLKPMYRCVGAPIISNTQCIRYTDVPAAS